MKSNMMTKCLIFFSLAISVFSYDFALFTPHHQQDKFWNYFAQFMKSACDDLGVTLHVHYADDNREKMKLQLRKAVYGESKVDAVFFQNFKQSGIEMIKIADQAKVPAFLVNSAVPHELAGKPREKYPYWIGEMLPDDVQAGYALAKSLVKSAREKTGKTKIHFAGISGIATDTSSVDRVKGMMVALEEDPEVKLVKLARGNWQKESGQRHYKILMDDKTPLEVVWAANDATALGVVEAAELTKTEVYVGGIDWTTEALAMIKADKMTVSYGGHFMEGAWAAVLVYDYLEGKDFASEKLHYGSMMGAISSSNVKQRIKKLSPESWSEIDFKPLSKVHNPERRSYEFDIEKTVFH